MTTQETRRTIPSHPNYEASSTGVIYRVGSEKPRSFCLDRKGYKRMKIDTKTRFVHQLVLEAFVCKRPDGMGCRHLDGNKWNNNLNNLRWGTARENLMDDISLNGRFRGAKLTIKNVKSIKDKLQAGGYSTRDIARLFNVGATAIRDIATCKTYAFV